MYTNFVATEKITFLLHPKQQLLLQVNLSYSVFLDIGRISWLFLAPRHWIRQTKGWTRYNPSATVLSNNFGKTWIPLLVLTKRTADCFFLTNIHTPLISRSDSLWNFTSLPKEDSIKLFRHSCWIYRCCQNTDFWTKMHYENISFRMKIQKRWGITGTSGSQGDFNCMQDENFSQHSHWNNLPRKVMDSPILETFRIHLDKVLGHLDCFFCQEKLDQMILELISNVEFYDFHEIHLQQNYFAIISHP